MMLIFLLQIVYGAVAIGYNIVSVARMRAHRKPLNDGPTTPAILVLLVYMGSLFLPDPGYRVAMAIFLVILGFPGILAHVKRGPTAFYSSRTSWRTAIAINAIGAILNLAGLVVGAP